MITRTLHLQEPSVERQDSLRYRQHSASATAKESGRIKTLLELLLSGWHPDATLTGYIIAPSWR